MPYNKIAAKGFRFMDDKDMKTLIRYQTALFTTLTGMLVARGVSTREEMARAIEIVANREADTTAKALLDMLRDALLDREETLNAAGQTPRMFDVVRGGRV